MDASILDLRYKMKDVLKAINRRERVRILYHGKVKGEIVPSKSNRDLKTINHPIFGISKDEKDSPEDIVSKMRRRSLNDF
jgi:antitoxin (DNA-binding transcriptional repressor) of toxin-antitoxin stability system